MKLNLVLRNGLFIPAFDEDYEKAKSLKREKVYSVSITEARNVEFNNKYHVLIDKAWNCLNEKQTEFFGHHGKEAFRKSMEITAGFYTPVFSFAKKEWQQIPRSTAFDKMTEDEFQELYEGVLQAIHDLLTNKTMSEHEFSTIFDDF